jgi:hypothetical protein
MDADGNEKKIFVTQRRKGAKEEGGKRIENGELSFARA